MSFISVFKWSGILKFAQWWGSSLRLRIIFPCDATNKLFRTTMWYCFVYTLQRVWTYERTRSEADERRHGPTCSERHKKRYELKGCSESFPYPVLITKNRVNLTKTHNALREDISKPLVILQFLEWRKEKDLATSLKYLAGRGIENVLNQIYSNIRVY
jgi:hypothetical protein